jgi:hypothetical protein
VRNPAYTGQARYGDATKDDAHEAIVPRSLWLKCQGKRKPSARTGRFTERYLLQGLCTCANCGSTLYLSGGSRKNPYYLCRDLHCDEHAYAQAAALDAFVLNTIDEAANAADPSSWVAKPGGDDREVEEAATALEDARADLDGWLADTKLRGILGGDRYADATADRVAVVNKAEADLASAREASSSSFDLVGRLWNTEWGWHERKEWVSRMVRGVVVSRGTEPLSRRCEVELR